MHPGPACLFCHCLLRRPAWLDLLNMLVLLGVCLLTIDPGSAETV